MPNTLAIWNRWVATETDAHDLALAARRAGVDRQQVRNLQRQAEVASDVQDILDYVKLQTLRVPAFRREQFAQHLLTALESLPGRSASASELAPPSHTALSRLYLRQLALSYAYSISSEPSGAPFRSEGRPARTGVEGQAGSSATPPRRRRRASAVAGAQNISALTTTVPETTASTEEPVADGENASTAARLPEIPAQDSLMGDL
ncbi:MAG: hypothetical protein M1118_13325 [Chloroflexi bacterium]|nr:hypothetical protein [Chloroflexota bacterium]